MPIARSRFAAQTTLSVVALAACSGTGRLAATRGTAQASPEMARWERQTVPSNASCRSISAATALVAWAGCTGGRVFRTTDGGTTWTVDTVPDAPRLDFRGIKAFDAG